MFRTVVWVHQIKIHALASSDSLSCCSLSLFCCSDTLFCCSDFQFCCSLVSISEWYVNCSVSLSFTVGPLGLLPSLTEVQLANECLHLTGDGSSSYVCTHPLWITLSGDGETTDSYSWFFYWGGGVSIICIHNP